MQQTNPAAPRPPQQNGGAPTQASPVVPPASGLPQRSPASQRPQGPQAPRPQGAPSQQAGPSQPPTQANRIQPPAAAPTNQPPSNQPPVNKPPTTSGRRVEGDDHLVAHHDSPPRRAEHPQAPTGQGPQGQGGRPPAPPNGGPTRPADAKPAPTEAGAGKNGNPAAKAPPWQRGPQNEPQSNLNRPGESPVTGRPPARPPRVAEGTAGVTTAAGAAGVEAAKNARREAAKSKSAAIDGPTRSIARPELAKDMPDLSEVRHPLPEPTASGQQKAVPVAVAATGAQAAVAADGTPLRATVQVRKIDPWSTLKVSLVISVALFFVWMVAVGLLYVVLDGMGVWDRLNNAFTDIVSESGSGGLVSGGEVFGYAAVIGIINVVLFTALATIGSFIYNQCSDLVGGVQVTLADPD
ncbi:DUF3566 domain-containing protein [Antrihabitans cavernicola]|uniref:DUF3566 domain-containing protein n=1 Tax=Antrihabitans cavernicola TaxID=2495913 RepID=A0A5A7SG34_9NOCA|nr:DUF3566 domain-containing protein [Spelaeibacter cavernicola]